MDASKRGSAPAAISKPVPVSKLAPTVTWKTRRGDSTVVDPDTGTVISVNGKPAGDATKEESGDAES